MSTLTVDPLFGYACMLFDGMLMTSHRMSRPFYPTKHIFCTATGVEVTDESLTVADYLQLEVR